MRSRSKAINEKPVGIYDMDREGVVQTPLHGDQGNKSLLSLQLPGDTC